ncbi:hypothetical protein A9D60_24035 [Leisingera sp. JC1]|nr:hypothetical protein A9D60_24035 [Leisingera sp. JC1]
MEQISDNWAFDISLLVQCLEKNLPYKNHNIGVLSDKRRGIEHYIPMADDIIEYFIEKFWE